MGTMTIGKLARAAEVGIDTVRFYERAGLLLRLNDGGGRRGAVRAVAERRLAEIEQKLAELARMRATLRRLVHECRGDGALAGCPIIEAVLPANGNSAGGDRKTRTA